MNLNVTFDRETDGRWIAEVEALPGVLAYGASRDEALAKVQAIALHTLADEVESGERDATTIASVQFLTSEAA